MEQIDTKIRRWGNSYGIVIPRKIMDKQRLKEGSEIVLSVQSKNKMTVGDLMNLARKLNLAKKLQKINTQRALKELDETFWQE